LTSGKTQSTVAGPNVDFIYRSEGLWVTPQLALPASARIAPVARFGANNGGVLRKGSRGAESAPGRCGAQPLLSSRRAGGAAFEGRHLPSRPQSAGQSPRQTSFALRSQKRPACSSGPRSALITLMNFMFVVLQFCSHALQGRVNVPPVESLCE